MNEFIFKPKVQQFVPTHWCNFLTDFEEFKLHSLSMKYKNRSMIFKNFFKAQKVNITPKQPLTLLKQSNNFIDSHIVIPKELYHLYLNYRPTLLKRARNLESALNTHHRIYFKYEGDNISGSHKLNTALAQAYYYKKAGVKHIVTGTGAGQWGTAIAYACQLFGIKCTIFMVNSSLKQKAQRKIMMTLFDANVYSSPSELTKVGRTAKLRDPKQIGCLAIATGEAIELANQTKDTFFAVGSGENCVLLHQTIIGNEAINQMELLDDFPNYIVACMGAGSNFAGIGMPFMRAAKEKKRNIFLLAAEPIACPKLTRGYYAYDVNDFSGTTPISKMYTLGSDYLAPSIHAGGLRYHGTSEFLSALYSKKLFDAIAIKQSDALLAGHLFAQKEGILPAPESAHAIAAAIDLCKKNQSAPSQAILINISGHGLFDLSAYEDLRLGKIDDCYPNEEMILKSLTQLKNNQMLFNK